MTGPSIRALTIGDRDAALGVINTAARWYRDFLPPGDIHDPEMTLEQWDVEARRLTWYGVFDGDMLVAVGGARVRPRCGPAAPWLRVARASGAWRRGLLVEHMQRQVSRIIVGTYAGNFKARGALDKAGYRLPANPEAVLRAYYTIPEDRLRSSVTYERQV